PPQRRGVPGKEERSLLAGDLEVVRDLALVGDGEDDGPVGALCLESVNLEFRGVLGFLEVAGEVDEVDPFPEPVRTRRGRRSRAGRCAGRISCPDAGCTASTSMPRLRCRWAASTSSSS